MKNQVFLEGNLGKDATFASTTTGQTVTKFSLAINKSWKNKSGKEETRTDWLQIEVWGKLATPASRLKKGDAVIIQGELRTGSYEKDGVTHNTTTISVNYLRKIDFSIFKGEDPGSAEE
jgi:single-strand DNA-binding protein